MGLNDPEMLYQQDMRRYGDVTRVTKNARIRRVLAQSVTHLWIGDVCYQFPSLIKIGRTDVSDAMFGDNDINITLCRRYITTGKVRDDAAYCSAFVDRR